MNFEKIREKLTMKFPQLPKPSYWDKPYKILYKDLKNKKNAMKPEKVDFLRSILHSVFLITIGISD